MCQLELRLYRNIPRRVLQIHTSANILRLVNHYYRSTVHVIIYYYATNSDFRDEHRLYSVIEFLGGRH